MGGEELAVEQAEPAHPEPRDEISERDLGGVAGAAEHALAEEGRAEPDAVEAADQAVVLPALDRMGVAAIVELGIGGLDLGVDPGVGPVRGGRGAGRNGGGEGAVGGDREAVRAQRLGERPR